MKTAMFPGSFDPIHMGHICLAKHALETLGLDKVIFVPSGVSPNKRHTQRTPGMARFQWIKASLAEINMPGLEVSDIESRHSVPTYTLESLQALKAQEPEGTEMFLLVGSDTAKRMQRWPSYKKVLETATVIAYGRDNEPGTISAPFWPHSSTDIRTKISEGKPIHGLVAKAIVPALLKNFAPKGPDIEDF